MITSFPNVKSSAGSSSVKKETIVKLLESKRFTCKFCQTDVKPKTDVCERCLKNFNEHGQPKFCNFCKLNSAFIGSKCQRCSSSQKKYGDPVKCSKCGICSAFDHEKAKINGKLLCWVCFVTVQRKLRHGKRKMELNENNNQKVLKYSPIKPSVSGKTRRQESEKEKSSSVKKQEDVTVSDLRRKAHLNSRKHHDQHKKDDHQSLNARLTGLKKNFSAPNSPSSIDVAKEKKLENRNSTPKSDTETSDSNAEGFAKSRGERKWNGSSMSAGLPSINDGNIVVVTKLREEIEALKKKLAKKDQQLLEKDKQLCLIKVDHLNEVKSIRTKYNNKEDEYLKSVETYRNKNQELLKKIAQISKGKA